MKGLMGRPGQEHGDLSLNLYAIAKMRRACNRFTGCLLSWVRNGPLCSVRPSGER